MADASIKAALGASLATQVGDLSTGDAAALNNFGNKVAHALVGCAMGAASTGHSEGCAAGALGAVIAEATAELYNAGSSGAKPFTKELGQITAIVAAAATGQDVAVAQLAGGNAVENNYLSHSEAYRREVLRDKQRKGMALTEAEARELANLDSLDAERETKFRQACQVQGDACDKAHRELNEAINSHIESSGYRSDLTPEGNAGIKAELNEGLALSNEEGLASQTILGGVKRLLIEQLPDRVVQTIFGTKLPKKLFNSTAAESFALRFGSNENQINHAMRHIEKSGFNIEKVKNAIEVDAGKIIAKKVSSPHNGYVIVDGKRVDYVLYEVSSGIWNVGRITPGK